MAGYGKATLEDQFGPTEGTLYKTQQDQILVVLAYGALDGNEGTIVIKDDHGWLRRMNVGQWKVLGPFKGAGEYLPNQPETRGYGYDPRDWLHKRVRKVGNEILIEPATEEEAEQWQKTHHPN